MPDIKLLNSQTASNVPSSLIEGQVAINEADGILYYRDAATGNPVALIWSGGSFTGAVQIDTGSGTAPNITAGLAFENDPDTGLAQLGGANSFSIVTNGTERVRIDSAGRLGIGTTPTAAEGIRFGQSLTGGTGANGLLAAQTVLSDVTNGANVFRTFVGTQASSFTLSLLSHFRSTANTFGAGSTVTTQIGFQADNTLTGATNNYGFRGDIADGSGRWNFYALGTAPNYFAGNVGIGSGTTTPTVPLHISTAVETLTTVQQFTGTSWGGGEQIDVKFTRGESSIASLICTLDAGATTGSLGIATGGTERLRVDSSGRVGIGNSLMASFNPNWDDLVVGSGAAQHGMTVFSTTQGTLAFADTATTGVDGYRGYLSYLHASDAMILGTGAAERIRIDSSGRVGIGRTPSVTGTSLECANDIFVAPTKSALFYQTNGSAGLGTPSGVGFQVWAASNITDSIRFQGRDASGTFTATDIVRIWTGGTSASRVGINRNTAPTVDLEIGDNTSTVRALSVRHSSAPAYLSNSYDGSAAAATLSVNAYETSSNSQSWSALSNANFAAAAVRVCTQSFASGSHVSFWTAASNTGTLTERMRIAGNGNVGIGTGSTIPTANLHVAGTTSTVAYVLQSGVTNSNACLVQFAGGNVGSTGAASAVFRVISNSTLRPLASFGDLTVVRANGWVGVGVANPTSNLHVAAPDVATYPTITIQGQNAGTTASPLANAALSFRNFQFDLSQANAREHLRIESLSRDASTVYGGAIFSCANAAGVTTEYLRLDPLQNRLASVLPVVGPVSTGTNGNFVPAFSMDSDINTGFGQVSGFSDSCSLFTAGTERVRVKADGTIHVGANTRTNVGLNMEYALPNVSASIGALWSQTIGAATTTFYSHYIRPYLPQTGTLSAVTYCYLESLAKPAGLTVGTVVGYDVSASIATGATANIGFRSLINSSAGGGNYNLYMSGTAKNYLNGDVGIKTTTPLGSLDVNGTAVLGNRWFHSFQGTTTNATNGPGVSGGIDVELNELHGTTPSTGFVYKITLTTPSTSTNNGSQYLVWYSGSAWLSREITQSGDPANTATNQNHPLLTISNGKVVAYNNHSSNYIFRCTIESHWTGNGRNDVWGMGADFHWRRTINNLNYSDGNVGIQRASPASALDVNGVITVAATAGTSPNFLPSVCFASDPNTGFGQVSGADTCSLITNGTERLRVGSDGQVTVVPDAARLNLGTGGSLRALAAGIFGFYGGTSLAMTVETTRINGYRPFYGNVPDSGGGFVVPNPSPSATRTAGYGFQSNVNTQAGETRYAIFCAGTAPSYFNGQLFVHGGSASAPSLSSLSSTTTGFYFPSPDVFAISTAGSERVRVNSSGNVGIGSGNTAPSAPLHVKGETKLEGPITEGYVNNGNSGTAKTIALTNGTVQNYTLTGTCTFTMPTAVAGQSFTVLIRTGATGGYNANFTGVKWPASGTPATTQAANKMDIFSFVSDGTNWYGTVQQGYTP